MNEISDQLREIIGVYSMKLAAIPLADFEYKPFPNKWSRKEILGHLIDSAQTNIRRFVVSQYETTPMIQYNQDKWVSIGSYQEYNSTDLIQLWALLNKHICVVLKHITPEMAMRNCRTSPDEEHNIEWIAKDYVRHLMHHLNQILPPNEV